MPSHFLFVSYGVLPSNVFLMELSPALCMFVSYGSLSGTMLFVSNGTLPSTVFVSYGTLSGTISDCGVTSGALSSTYASTTGLQTLMEATLGHEESQSRGVKHSSYPPFITY